MCGSKERPFRLEAPATPYSRLGVRSPVDGSASKASVTKGILTGRPALFYVQRLTSLASLKYEIRFMSALMREKVKKLPVRTILVVDDFDDTRLMMRLWLEKRGYRVVEAANGLEALEVARRESPHLVIMDIEMPEMDGLTATRRIHEEEGLRDVPIVAVSAYGAEHWRDRALAAGCVEYVSTPFEPKELSQLIESLLQ